MELQLINSMSLSGEGLLDRLMKKEAERDSYNMDHPAWDILNQECKELVLAVSSLTIDQSNKLVEEYREKVGYKEVRQSGNFYGVSSYDKEYLPEFTQYCGVMNIAVKIVYILSGYANKVYHFNAYALQEEVEKARCSDEKYALAYYEKLGSK